MNVTHKALHGRTASHGPQDLFECAKQLFVKPLHIANEFKIPTQYYRCLLGGKGEICVQYYRLSTCWKKIMLRNEICNVNMSYHRIQNNTILIEYIYIYTENVQKCVKHCNVINDNNTYKTK